MLAVVPEHVHQDAPHLSRRLKLPRVEAIGPEGASPTQNSIDAMSESHREALHAARQRDLTFGLDDEVNMISLQ